MRKERSMVKELSVMGLFVAMSVIGAFIKIPSPTGTVALDSLPGYLAALLLGGLPGAVVGFLGHLASAATTGFMMTLPIHLLVACEMAAILSLVSMIAKKSNIVLAVIAAILLNGVGAPAVFILIPGFGISFFVGMVIPLLVGSAINILLAGAIYYPLRNNKMIQKVWETKNGL